MPVVTSKGREIMTGRMRGSSPTQAEPLFIGWDTGGFTGAVSDVGPFGESAETRITGTSSLVTTTTTNDTYQVTGTMTATGARTITAVLLTDSSTKPFSTTVTGGTAVGSNSGTTLTTAASYTPANGTTIQIRTEVLTVTAGTGTTSLTVTRGSNGSAAISTIANSDPVTAGNAPGSTTITGGSMYIHGEHGSTTLATGESIAYTVTCKIT
jgi:hypothetical protein